MKFDRKHRKAGLVGGVCAATEGTLSKGDTFCTPRLTRNIWKFCLVAASGSAGRRRANRDTGTMSSDATAGGGFTKIVQECHRDKFALIAT